MSAGNTLNDLKALINSYRSDGEISGPELTDIFRTIANLFEQNNTESLNLAWRTDIIYDRPTTAETSGNPSYSEFNDRFWRSKTDNNQNNPPPNDSVTTENTHWIEVSKASSNPISEWTPGIFGNGLVIVFHNDTFYKLNVATRPYESVNIENEISNLDWLEIPSELANKLSKGINTLGIATYLFSEFQFDIQLPNARLDFNDGSLDLNFPNSGFQFFDGAMTIALTGKGYSVNTGDGLYYEDIVGPYKRIFQVPSGDGSTDFRFEFRNKSTNALIQSFVFNENGARYTAPYGGSNGLDIVTRAWIEAITGILSTLNTVDKSSLGNAVNEVLAIAQSAGGGGGTPLGFYDLDASTGVLPTTGSGSAGAIRLGDRWLVAVAGTLDDGVNTPVQVEVDDVLIAKVNSPTDLTGFVVTQRNINLADQATAEGGSNNVLVMTSLRTRQQFRSLISDALLSILQGTQESFTTALRVRLIDSLVSTDNNLVGTTIYTFASEFFNVNNAASGRDLRIGTADGFYYEDTQGTHKRIIHIPSGINESEIRFEVRSPVDNSLLVALVIDENGVRREGSFSVSSPQDVLTRSVIESISVLKSESENFTTAEKNKVGQSVISNPTGVTGADQITNIISLTQAEYDAIASPDASTLYVIT